MEFENSVNNMLTCLWLHTHTHTLINTPRHAVVPTRRDIVRSVDCFDGAAARQLLCVTAGEDAQLALWTLDAATAAAAAAASSSRESGDSAGPQRQHQGRAAGGGADSSSVRRSPY